MEQVFKFIRNTRQAFIELLDGLTLEQINQIPEGFNNNIIWNFGHIVVATQALCYVRSGILPDASSIKYVQSYVKGSKPTCFVSQEEVDELKRLAIQTIDQIEQDYKAGKFSNITPFATDTYKETLPSIEDVITLTAGHDNLHYGYAIAQRRLINK